MLGPWLPGKSILTVQSMRVRGCISCVDPGLDPICYLPQCPELSVQMGPQEGEGPLPSALNTSSCKRCRSSLESDGALPHAYESASLETSPKVEPTDGEGTGPSACF